MLTLEITEVLFAFALGPSTVAEDANIENYYILAHF